MQETRETGPLEQHTNGTLGDDQKEWILNRLREYLPDSRSTREKLALWAGRRDAEEFKIELVTTPQLTPRTVHFDVTFKEDTYPRIRIKARPEFGPHYGKDFTGGAAERKYKTAYEFSNSRLLNRFGFRDMPRLHDLTTIGEGDHKIGIIFLEYVPGPTLETKLVQLNRLRDALEAFKTGERTEFGDREKSRLKKDVLEGLEGKLRNRLEDTLGRLLSITGDYRQSEKLQNDVDLELRGIHGIKTEILAYVCRTLTSLHDCGHELLKKYSGQEVRARPIDVLTGQEIFEKMKRYIERWAAWQMRRDERIPADQQYALSETEDGTLRGAINPLVQFLDNPTNEIEFIHGSMTPEHTILRRVRRGGGGVHPIIIDFDEVRRGRKATDWVRLLVNPFVDSEDIERVLQVDQSRRALVTYEPTVYDVVYELVRALGMITTREMYFRDDYLRLKRDRSAYDNERLAPWYRNRLSRLLSTSSGPYTRLPGDNELSERLMQFLDHDLKIMNGR